MGEGVAGEEFGLRVTVEIDDLDVTDPGRDLDRRSEGLLLEEERARRVDRSGAGLGLRQRAECRQSWPNEPCGQRYRHDQDRQDDLDTSARIRGRGADDCGPSGNWGKPRGER